MMEEVEKKLNRYLKRAGRMTSLTKQFNSLKTDEEKFEYSLGLVEESKILPSIEVIAAKNSKISVEKRKAGNELYKSILGSIRRTEILALYTESIAYAENDSLELAFSYGNRSALLWEARLFDHCLLDIERALKLNYPQHLKAKLLQRQILCMKIIHKSKPGLDDGTLTLTMNMMRDSSIKQEVKLQFLNESQDHSKREQRPILQDAKSCPEAPSDNAEVPGASGAVSIAWNQRRGRHIVATRTIYPGEVLAVAREFTCVTSLENLYTHCSNCLKQTFSAVPCLHCPKAVFCNEACRDEAWKNQHDVECRVVRVLLEWEFRCMGMMSLRLLIKAVRNAGGFQALKNQVDAMASWKDPRTKGFVGEPPIFNVDDYRSVYSLSSKAGSEKGVGLILTRSIKAVMMMYCLGTMSDFLGEKMPLGDIKVLRRNPWSAFLGGLLIHFQYVISSNGTSLQSHLEGFRMLPFLDLFNHSCNPMVLCASYDRAVAVYAIQTIAAGEEVCANYGPHYAYEPLLSRSLWLEREYSFYCQCRPCQEFWPMVATLPGLNPFSIRNPEIEGKDVAKVDDLEAVQSLYHLLKLFHNACHGPNREYIQIIEALKEIYGLHGRRFHSLEDPCKTTKKKCKTASKTNRR